MIRERWQVGEDEERRVAGEEVEERSMVGERG